MIGVSDLDLRNTQIGFRGSVNPLERSDFILVCKDVLFLGRESTAYVQFLKGHLWWKARLEMPVPFQ